MWFALHADTVVREGSDRLSFLPFKLYGVEVEISKESWGDEWYLPQQGIQVEVNTYSEINCDM